MIFNIKKCFILSGYTIKYPHCVHLLLKSNKTASPRRRGFLFSNGSNGSPKIESVCEEMRVAKQNALPSSPRIQSAKRNRTGGEREAREGTVLRRALRRGPDLSKRFEAQRGRWGARRQDVITRHVYSAF
jgi:hypothetical protein